MTAAANAFSATPVNSRPAMDPGVIQRAMRSSVKQTVNAPAKGAGGKSHGRQEMGIGRLNPEKTTMVSAAAQAAPPLPPKKPPSPTKFPNKNSLQTPPRAHAQKPRIRQRIAKQALCQRTSHAHAGAHQHREKCPGQTDAPQHMGRARYALLRGKSKGREPITGGHRHGTGLERDGHAQQ